MPRPLEHPITSPIAGATPTRVLPFLGIAQPFAGPPAADPERSEFEVLARFRTLPAAEQRLVVRMLRTLQNAPDAAGW